jgi:hypothetical protein
MSDDPMTTATAEMFLRRAEQAEVEVERLREALDVAVYFAENLQRVIDHKPVRDLDESRAAFERVRKLAPDEHEPSRHGYRHADDGSECMEPAWCPRPHVRTSEVASDEDDR